MATDLRTLLQQFQADQVSHSRSKAAARRPGPAPQPADPDPAIGKTFQRALASLRQASVADPDEALPPGLPEDGLGGLYLVWEALQGAATQAASGRLCALLLDSEPACVATLVDVLAAGTLGADSYLVVSLLDALLLSQAVDAQTCDSASVAQAAAGRLRKALATLGEGDGVGVLAGQLRRWVGDAEYALACACAAQLAGTLAGLPGDAGRALLAPHVRVLWHLYTALARPPHSASLAAAAPSSPSPSSSAAAAAAGGSGAAASASATPRPRVAPCPRRLLLRALGTLADSPQAARALLAAAVKHPLPAPAEGEAAGEAEEDATALRLLAACAAMAGVRAPP